MDTQQNNNQYLCWTSSLFLVSLLYVFLHSQRPVFEYVLASLLGVLVLTSQLFWSNPIEGSTVHQIDAIVAKMVFVLFAVYTLLYKFSASFLLLLSAMGVAFYFSNEASTEAWCSNAHLFWHGCLHSLGVVGTLYTFAPI